MKSSLDSPTAASTGAFQKTRSPSVIDLPEVDEISLLREEILRRLDEMAGELRRGDDEKREIAGLRAELRRFREDDLERRLDPVLISLIRLSDTVARRAAAFRELPPERRRADDLLEQFEGVELDLSLLLEKYEISVYREEGDVFEPRLQQVARLELTEDPGRIGRIAARVRPGFLHRERIIMKERVAVYSDLESRA